MPVTPQSSEAAECAPAGSGRSPRVIVLAWLVLALAAIPFASTVNERLDAAARLEGSDSAKVTAALRERFGSPFAEVALLRVAGAPFPPAPEGKALLKRVCEVIRTVPGVSGVISHLDGGDPLFIGQDGSPIVIVGLNTRKASPEALIARVRTATEALRLQLGEQDFGVRFRWTGEAAINADIRRASSDETHTAELRVLPLTLLLLLVAFRSLVCAALPVVCGALTVLVALGMAAIVNRFWPVSVILVSVVSMVGLGLSIDYALLMVSRYREALQDGLDPRSAARQASRRAGRTVVVSGTAVAIGFGALLLVRVSEVRSIGLGGLLVTAVSVLAATSLLPVVLTWIGPWLEATRRGRDRRQERGRLWRLWADWVSRHPLRVLAVAGLPLLALVAQADRLRTDLPRGRWLPADVESVQVFHELEAIGRSSFGQTIRVIVELPAQSAVETESGWRAVSRLADFFAHDARVDRVWAVATLDGAGSGGPGTVRLLPDPVRRSLVSTDGQAALVELLPREGIAPAEATRLVRQIRAMDPQAVTGLAGARTRVGGVPAFNADYEDAVAKSVMQVAACVVGATFLALAVAFRSVLIPLKAVALNLLSVAAAFGAVVLVFQDGYGLGLVGLDHPIEGGFPILPVLVFCTVFGLSMDYEVFLVARVADAHRAALDDGAALAEGMASTGRVITLAAAIMVVIFGGFVLGDFVLIKMLGFALGVAVLLDATVVRLALGPALIRLAGRWNWWPGGARTDRCAGSAGKAGCAHT
jgi:RND superfamily putative drug exporter